MHDLSITFLPQFSKQKSAKTTPTPTLPKKAHSEELASFHHAAEYLILSPKKREGSKVNFSASTWKLSAKHRHLNF